MADRTFASRYQNLVRVGTGGMGEVFRAQDSLLLNTVAIKVLRKKNSPEAALRFQKEARATARLNHPNIVNVLDFGVTDNLDPYMVMEFLDGDTLADFLTEQDTIPLSQFLQIVFQIGAALSHAHRRQVLHRDLKPTNVIVHVNEQTVSVKLVDFGIAKVFEADQSLTSTGTILGSPLYMSPEQANALAVDERSDVYAMGCLMYECLSGHPPFRGATAIDTITMHKSAEPEPLDEHLAPSWLNKIVIKCLNKAPQDRYQSVDELLQDLAKRYAESGIANEAVDKVAAPFRPHNKAPATILILLAISLAIAGWITIRQSQSPDLGAKVEPVKRADVSLTSREERMFNWATEKSMLLDKNRLKISGMTDEELRQCATAYPQAIDIDLNTSPIDGSGLRHLVARKPKIIRLRSEIKDQNFKYLAQMLELKILKFQGLQESNGAGFKLLKNLTMLDTIILENCRVPNEMLKQISEIPSLKFLRLKGCYAFDADGLSYLKKLRLESLDLREAKMDDSKVEGLRNLLVRDLSLASNPAITNKSVNVLKTLKRVDAITLGDTSVSLASRLSLAAALGLQYRTTDEIALRTKVE